VPLAFRR